MKTSTNWNLRRLTLAAAVLCPAASSQDRTPLAAADAEQRHSAGPALAPRPELAGPFQPQVHLNREMGEPQRAVAVLSDEVPRPWRLSGDGDEADDSQSRRLEEDPFFLGFAGGLYYPPADERLDPRLVAQAAQAALEGRTHTFGFVMFQRRMTHERLAALAELGARVLEFHPHHSLKVALPVNGLDSLAALDFVRWVGVAQPFQKLHPALAQLEPERDGKLPLYVNVFESDLNLESTWTPAATAWRADGALTTRIDDPELAPRIWRSNGPAQRALAEQGIEIVQYVDEIRAFRVRALPGQLEQLVGLDFVQFIEPNLAPRLGHDESTPMIGADYSRSVYPGNSSGVVSIAEADSGLDNAHSGLQIMGWGWDFTGLGTPWADGCEHGTHVMGTILGSGAGSFSNSHRGVAPGLARGGSATRAYVARIFDNACGFSGTANATIFSVNRAGFWDGFGNTTKPQLSSNSWGIPGTGWVGTEADARTVDAEVWNHDQIYLFCAGNSGPGAQTIWQQATAKNALTVGSVRDYYPVGGFPTLIAGDSSRGPCGDGRWKPNVVAPGDSVTSVDANTANGYQAMSGTSMATPHVAGLAAQLTDAASWLRYNPAGVMAVLMSSAETKGGALLSAPSNTHLREYGAGKVSAHKAILGSTDYYWNTWTFNATQAGGWTFADFVVPASCVRITVCMTYLEPAASAGASQALVNDWDLYIDDPANGINPAGNAGDFVVQQSALDNTEIRSIPITTGGTWRWKVWPRSVLPGSTVKMAVTVTYELYNAGCSPAVDVSTAVSYAKPGQSVTINAQATNYFGLASAASFESFSTGIDTLQLARGQLFDGPLTNLLPNSHLGRRMVLGDIPPGQSRSIQWQVSWSNEGVHNFGAYLDTDNAAWLSDSVNVTVDGTPPQPVILTSNTHQQWVWSNNPNIGIQWNTPTDNLSGVAGYAWTLSTNGIPLDPGTTQNLSLQNSMVVNSPSSSSDVYVSMRPVDNAGNWTNGYSWTVPFRIDTVSPTAPGSLASSTHPAGVQQCGTNVTMTWAAATDAHAGVAGYLALWDSSPLTVPGGPANLAANATNFSQNIGSSATARYFHLRALDLAGNYGPTAHYGPVLANASSAQTYCTAKTNSLGCVPAIGSVNQPSRSAGDFTVNCVNVLNQKNGLLFWGFASVATPFQGGTLCVASPTLRTPASSSGGPLSGTSCTGVYSFNFSTSYMNSVGLAPGQTVFAQWWMRDPASSFTSGFSNGVRFTVCQ